MVKLTNKAVLVQLSIGVPTLTRLDRAISSKLTADAGAVDGSIRGYKSLLPNADLLKQITTLKNSIRSKFYTNTLPWGIKGTYILPTRNYMDFVSDFKQDRHKFLGMAAKFSDSYSDMVHAASVSLGKGFNAADYPTQENLEASFYMNMRTSSLPAEDFRYNDMSDEEEQAIRDSVTQEVTDAAQVAMTEVWQRLYDRTKRFADKLNDPAAVFNNSTIELLTELCSILPRLNFADDPNLEDMRQQVERTLTGYHPDHFRNDPVFRKDRGQAASDIVAQMAAFMEPS
jgi:hypothetical protein|tara:strand:- start:1520 stop:2377 length:858 start_codon:yes stop_codon:yes gene_type:complete